MPIEKKPAPYLAANLDLLLSQAPLYHRVQIPITPMIMRPPSNVTPRPTPRLRKSGVAKWMAPAAMLDLAKSLNAKSEAEYCGYVSAK